MIPAGIGLLRSAFSGYTVDAVHDLVGTEAWLALARNETVPAERATRSDSSPIAIFTRLFQLGRPVPVAAGVGAFGEEGLGAALAAGILCESEGNLRALVDVRPYGDETHDWWVVCDPTPGMDGRHEPMRSDFVLGISEASNSLAQLVGRTNIGSALDLGTGCGVQALHLATHADRVVATDVNSRALWMAELTAALNGAEVDVRAGSLYEPVDGERFDLICTNPPFVVSPPQHDRLIYRETGFDGDDVVRRIVAGAADHLNDDGWCQVLASWQIMAGESWDQRLGGWLDGTGLDAWVVQRERADLPLYVDMWLSDAGLRGSEDYVRRYDEWLGWFAERGVEAMGFGWINLRKAGRAVPVTHFEEYLGPVSGPVGPDVLAWAEAVDALEAGGVLEQAWRLVDGVRQHTSGPVGAADPSVIEIRRSSGIARVEKVDTIEAGFLSVCDGELTAGAVLDALASLLDRDPAELRNSYIDRVAQFVRDGFLCPVR